MKRKLLLTIALVLVVALIAAVCLVGCKDKDKPGETKPGETTPGETNPGGNKPDTDKDTGYVSPFEDNADYQAIVKEALKLGQNFTNSVATVKGTSDCKNTMNGQTTDIFLELSGKFNIFGNKIYGVTTSQGLEMKYYFYPVGEKYHEAVTSVDVNAKFEFDDSAAIFYAYDGSMIMSKDELKNWTFDPEKKVLSMKNIIKEGNNVTEYSIVDGKLQYKSTLTAFVKSNIDGIEIEQSSVTVNIITFDKFGTVKDFEIPQEVLDIPASQIPVL